MVLILAIFLITFSGIEGVLACVNYVVEVFRVQNYIWESILASLGRPEMDPLEGELVTPGGGGGTESGDPPPPPSCGCCRAPPRPPRSAQHSESRRCARSARRDTA